MNNIIERAVIITSIGQYDYKLNDKIGNSKITKIEHVSSGFILRVYENESIIIEIVSGQYILYYASKQETV